MRDLNSVRDLLRRPDTLLFVGSGASRWSGLPSWQELLNGLCSELDRLGRNSEVVRRELNGGDLLLAASYAFDQLTREERRSFLRATFVGADSGPSELHRVISRLGPTCFITTNYDSLIERTLTNEKPGEYFDVVTPAHRLEIPAIVQARANHFVFKPHGDIGNSDTIVLTREDYRTLQADRRNVFDATKTLMASRPVVFIGFGLRDPDFLLIRDQLLGTYTSNPADHVAIMPDVHDLEAQYWRRNYGIELLSYSTDSSATNTHQSMLDLLYDLSVNMESNSANEPAINPMDEPQTILSLARYARGLAENLPGTPDSFPLQFSHARIDERSSARSNPPWHLTASDAFTTLVQHQGNLLIEGPPGSGKSFLTASVARHMAQQLEEACLAGNGLPIGAPVPALAPLRDYRGDLTEMLEQILPVDVPLASLIENGRAYLILDGVNEIAPRYEASFQQDLSELLANTNNTVVVNTRFAAPVEGAELTTVRLDAVTSEHVDEAVKSRSIDPNDVNPETLELLRRPFFFSAWTRGDIELALTSTVHDVYSQLAERQQNAIQSRFDIGVSLRQMLDHVAYTMIDAGDLSASQADVTAGLSTSLPDHVHVPDVLDFLLETGLLIATPLKRLAFFHHSITEYLAASHVARLIEHDPTMVIQCLGRVDWDQTLLLALGFLNDDVATRAQATIMRVDAAMGLRSLRFLEQDRDEWLSQALLGIPEELSMNEEYEIADALQSATFRDVHVEALETLSRRHDYIGGTAAAKLYDFQPANLDRLLGNIVHGRYGYNYLTRVADLIKGQVDETTAMGCLTALEQREREQQLSLSEAYDEDELFVAEISAISAILKNSVSVHACVERARSSNSLLVKMAVGDRVRDTLDPLGIEYVRERIVAGSDQAIIDHYFQIAHLRESDGPKVPTPTAGIISVLISKVPVAGIGEWSLGLLRALTKWAPETEAMIAQHTDEGLLGALLKYARGDLSGFEKDLQRLIEAQTDWDLEPTFALEHVSGISPRTVRELLSTRHDGLAAAVLETLPSASVHGQGQGLNLHLADEVDSYLDWLGRLAAIEPYSFPALRMAEFLCEHTDDTTRDALLSKFNCDPTRRQLINAWILRQIRGISLDDFVPESIEWLLAHAGQDRHLIEPSSALEIIATEHMVSEHLIPKYLAERNDELRTQLGEMLRAIGRRHSRRYIGDDGEVVA